jgi:hypothetical protein
VTPRLFRRVFSAASFGPLFFLASLLVPLGVALYLIVFAKAPVPTTSAVLVTVNNVVQVQPVNNPGFQPAQEQQVLVAGDKVQTSDSGRGVITFIDESSLTLEPDSQLTILPPQRRGGGLFNRIDQSFGSSFAQFSSLAAGGGRYEIQTPAGIVSVRDGAVLRVGVGTGQAGKTTVQVIVLQGEAELRPSDTAQSAKGQAVVIGAGQTVTATEGEDIPAPTAFVPVNDVLVQLHSPFWMVVTEPNTGLATGLIPPDKAVLQIPLSLTTANGVSPQTVRLGDVVPGTYTVYLIPKKDGGDFTVTADGAAQGAPVFSDARSGTTAGCEWLYLLLNIDVDDQGLMTFGSLQGPFQLTSLPFVSGQKYDFPCPPPAPKTAQVAGVQATPTAVPVSPTPPPPQPTEAPLPTEAPPPPPQPTPAPTTAPPTPVPTISDITDIVVPPPEPTQAPPPPQPTPPPHPDIEITHTEDSIAGPDLPLAPLLLALAPGLIAGLTGLRRRRGPR